MPSLEIRVDSAGADYVPHVFMVLKDDNGNEQSWGYAPEKTHNFWGPGKVYDETGHEYDKSWTYEISEQQLFDLQQYVIANC